MPSDGQRLDHCNHLRDILVGRNRRPTTSTPILWCATSGHLVTIFFGVLLALAAGVMVKISLERYSTSGYRVTRNEFIAGAVICSLLVVPLVTLVGNKVARGNQLKYNEFWGGFETATHHDITPCQRDGNCAHTYDCDSYNHVHVNTTTDSKGNTTTTHENHTHYHSCPYSTEEWSFIVETDFGPYAVVDHGFPDRPREWRGGSGIPGDVHRGIPQAWLDSKAALKAGTPFGVTVRRKYDNYILASQNSILKKYAGETERFRRSGQLPDMAQTSDSWMRADKFHVPKTLKNTQVDETAWQQAVLRFGGYLGSKRQGDLHVVVVDQAFHPDLYTGALNAWWTGKQFGRNALSKNGVVLVLGVSENKVGWARLFTGMPLGNERLQVDVRSALKGVDFTPAAILGTPTPKSPGEGAFARVALGNPGFVRICMLCNDKGESGGFTYLSSEVQPTRSQRVVIYLFGLLFSLAVWTFFGGYSSQRTI